MSGGKKRIHHIPENVCIDAYDLRGSWADDFEKFVADNKSELADGTSINLDFSDIEEVSTWEREQHRYRDEHRRGKHRMRS